MANPTQSFAGFDTYGCPDAALTQRLFAETNLRWMGYYLHAPSQPAHSWAGKRAQLVAQGWGLAPIYVGQQTAHSGRGSHIVNAAQGRVDGLDAAAEMLLEGFPPGSCVFLDWEDGSPLLYADQDYITAWVDTVRAKGFAAGVYCSYLIAPAVAKLRQNLRIWVFHVPSTRLHAVTGKIFPAPDPSSSGFAGAVIWQREDEAQLVDFGSLAVDLDVAAMPDPSAPASPVVVRLPDPRPAQPAGPAPPVTLPAPPPPAPLGFWARLWAWLRP